MKTLKQRINELYEICDEEGLIPNEIDIVNTVKEWLKQKLPKIKDENTLTRYNCINELLEELNHE